MERKDDYLSQDIFNPRYLFHGSPYEIEKLTPKLSVDSENKDNEDNAVFLTSWFITAAAYAFRNKLKEVNDAWSFSINNRGVLPAMYFEVENLPEDMCGYIYVFDKDDSMVKDNHEGVTQYRCYHDLEPIDVIKVYYSDFDCYFERGTLKNKNSSKK